MSLLTLGVVVLRSRRMIAAMAVTCGVLGLLFGLLSPREFTSTATMIPQGAEAGQSGGLAAAASQFGIRIPTGGGGSGTWGTAVYVDLLSSRGLLEPIVLDTFVVAEAGGQRRVLLDVLNAAGPTAALRLNDGVSKLGGMITATESKSLGGIKLRVSTRWPSVSQGVATRLIDALNEFNLQTRRSQANAERRFVEARAAEAEVSMRDAEDRLSASLDRNRMVAGSPQLSLERDRLQRNVILRQQLYTSLLQSLDEARIREVRDTPVITLLEEPGLPAVGEPRRSLQKAVIGGFAGALLGAIFALFSFRIGSARRDPSDDARVFFDQLSEAIAPVRRLIRDKK